MTHARWLAAAGTLALCIVALPAVPATTAAFPDSGAEFDSPLSAAERELFRQDVEHLQQNFYQASPESRRRWIEAVRERRLQLDQQEDQAALAQPRIKATRASAPDLPRGGASRSPLRERSAD